MENYVSADNALKQIKDLQAQQTDLMKQNTSLEERVKELSNGSELSKWKSNYDSLLKMYNELQSAYTTQSKNFNDVITKYGVQVDEKPAKSQEEVEQEQEVNDILKKIEEQNNGNKE